MKNIVILGASGSVGLQTLDVIARHPDKFRCVALSVKSRVEVIAHVLHANAGLVVCVERSEDALKYSTQFPQHRFVWGEDGLIEVACLKEADTVVNALVGFIGCKPTLAAIEAKKNIALANKETLVAAGKIVMAAVRRNGVSLMPIDSEHSAIAQCLSTHNSNVKRLILTASGGSFRHRKRSELNEVTLTDALNHPNWCMGAKITIDSATMMNKGLEVIEARWLFDQPFDQIDVIMHHQSIVHSMVEFEDRAVIAQLGTLDMRVPIQYALSYPHRFAIELESLDLVKAESLTFEAVDFERFPLLKCAYLAGKREDNSAAALNGANEEAVGAFLLGKIPFIEIDTMVVEAFESMSYNELNSLDDAIAADQMGRQWIRKKISGGNV